MLKAYLIDTVTLKQHRGKDKWGTINPTTNLTVSVRVDYKERRVTGAENEIVVSMAKVLMEPRTIITGDFATRGDNTISYLDLITLDGVDRRIVWIAKAQDFRMRHLEVYVA